MIIEPGSYVSPIIFLSVVGAVLFLFILRIKHSDFISSKRKIELELQHTNRLFETLFSDSSLGMALLKLDGHFYRMNKAFCDLYGYIEHELKALTFFDLIQKNEVNTLKIEIQYMLEHKTDLYKGEFESLRKNNETIWIMATLSLMRNVKGQADYFILQAHNISLQKKAEERLKHMAYHDPLTGLANRNKLEQFVNHILAASRRHQQGFAILFLDLDHFKTINDTIGHESGDFLLQIVAERLRSAVRNTDLVARLGGDEFVIVITDVKKTESVALIAQKILENVLQALAIQGQEIYITTSIGISLYPYDGHNIQVLMKNADLALYRSKDHGRNNYQFYTLEMTNKAQDKLALQSALGHALAMKEFHLNYLPQMDLTNKRITSVEALLRWKNQDYGMITPDQIVDLAEETGLIIPVSEWIFNTACQQLKSWHILGLTELKIAYNCSVRQFKQATFVDYIIETLTCIGLPPDSLEVEVTERIISQDPENTIRVLYALKDLGIKIAIDDFGTGYWSLNNLRRLSVDKVKIDKSFIKNIILDDTSAAITSAIIAMAKKLNIKSIAEGVETTEQLEFLKREGISEIQGYYLTKPLPSDLMTKFLKHPVPEAERVGEKVN